MNKKVYFLINRSSEAGVSLSSLNIAVIKLVYKNKDNRKNMTKYFTDFNNCKNIQNAFQKEDLFHSLTDIK